MALLAWSAFPAADCPCDKTERKSVLGDLPGFKRGCLHVTAEIVAKKHEEVMQRLANLPVVARATQHRHATLDIAGHDQPPAISAEDQVVVLV
jgi:hypothetical protein